MIPRRTTFAPAKRFFLIASALACFAAAGFLTPSDVRSQLDVRAHNGEDASPAPIEAPPAAIAPAGDAFAPRATLDEEPRPAPGRALPALPPVPARVPIRPRPTSLLSVTAIATGADPTAIVEEGGSVRVVTIGDALDGSAVTAITDAGVVLADGRRLTLGR
jgi:hypothetical protein